MLRKLAFFNSHACSQQSYCYRFPKWSRLQTTDVKWGSMHKGAIQTFIVALLLFTAASGQIIQQDKEESGNDLPCYVIRAIDLVDPSAPRFESYPASFSQPRRSPKLDLSSHPIARKYRTVLRREISEGVNYAGHYRLAVWGCGSSCAMFAVVNLRTGKVITASDVQTVSGYRLMADEFLPDEASEYWGFRFTKNSRLLVLMGILDEEESRQGAFYFVLNHDRLTLVHKTEVTKPCDGKH
jgi:hypothetical protein